MRLLIIVFFVGSIVFTSCKKLDLDSIKSASWNPQFATPLAYGTFTVKDMLVKFDTSGIIKDNNSDLSIVVTSSFPALNASKFITIPDVSQVFDITPPELTAYKSKVAPFNVLPSGVVLNSTAPATQIVNFPLNSGQEITNVDFTSGDLAITISTDLQQDINMVLTFPDFLQGGVPLQDSMQLIYPNNNQPMTKTLKFSLANVKADFTNQGTDVNKIRVNAVGKVIGTGQTVSGNEYLNMTCAVSNSQFSEIKGYFGQITVSNPVDTVLLNQFESFKISKGIIALTNPSIKMNVTNTFGFPIDFTFNSFAFQDITGGQTTPMTHTPTSMTILYPNYASKGNAVTTEIDINTTNTTNLDQLISSVSRYLFVQPSAMTNKNGKTGQPNYVLGTSQLKLDTEIDIPMEGFATGFERYDTINVQNTFSNLDNTVKNIIVRLVLNNGFPLEIDGSLYFVDDQGNVIKNNGVMIDLLKINPMILASAKEDVTGTVIENTTTVNDITISSDLFPLLKNAKSMVFKSSIGTDQGANKKSVKLRDDYTIGFKIGVNIQGGLKSNN